MTGGATGAARPGALVSSLPGEDERFDNALRNTDMAALRQRVRSVRGCARPVWLSGSWSAQRPDGAAVAEHSGQIAVACGNRRAAVCESCAARYAGDAYQLVKAGLSGGKGVPEEAAEHRRAFVTLTAPSFGPVHTRPTSPRGVARSCRCGVVHSEHDAVLGTALDPGSYDYTGAVLFNAYAGALWHRFRVVLARLVAAAVGVRVSRAGEVFRLSYAKVAEYQRRGLVHFHAVIRLDGPAGPGDPAPVGVDEQTLRELVLVAARRVAVPVEPTEHHAGYTLRWGEQIQVDSIEPTAPDGSEGRRLHDRRVAGYIAKYATKGTETTSGADVRIRSEAHIAGLDVSEHHRAMIRTAWRIGHRRWAHMLGFGGHFLTKSKYYSTTFTELRHVRAQHQRSAHLAELGIDDTEAIELVGDWSFVGIGWANAAQRELAQAMSNRHNDAGRTYDTARADIDGGEHG